MVRRRSRCSNGGYLKVELAEVQEREGLEALEALEALDDTAFSETLDAPIGIYAIDRNGYSQEEIGKRFR